MTTYQRNRSYASAPEPEYGDLEIRCTWSGEYDEFVHVKISLEVIANRFPAFPNVMLIGGLDPIGQMCSQYAITATKRTRSGHIP